MNGNKVTNERVLKIVEPIMKNGNFDFGFSQEIFINYEEGKEDAKIKSNKLNKSRRDWLVNADIFNNGNYNQAFHLWYYLQYKIRTNKIKLQDTFNYSYIRNAALIIYIREKIFNEDIENIKILVEEIKTFYDNNDNMINRVPNLKRKF